MSIGTFYFAAGRIWGCACIAGFVYVAWSSPIVAHPLVTTTTLGSCGSVNTIWILLLQFILGGFNKGLGAGSRGLHLLANISITLVHIVGFKIINN